MARSRRRASNCGTAGKNAYTAAYRRTCTGHAPSWGASAARIATCPGRRSGSTLRSQRSALIMMSRSTPACCTASSTTTTRMRSPRSSGRITNKLPGTPYDEDAAGDAHRRIIDFILEASRRRTGRPPMQRRRSSPRGRPFLALWRGFGATALEARQPMPGDEILPSPIG